MTRTLPVELLRQIVHYVIWDRTKGPREAWEDGEMMSLLPDLHPMASMFDGHVTSEAVDEEGVTLGAVLALSEPVGALLATSKLLRKVTKSVGWRYFCQVQNVSLGVDPFCDCTDDEPAVSWEECNSCGSVPRQQWSLRTSKTKTKAFVRSLRLTERDASVHDMLATAVGWDALVDLADNPPTLPTHTRSDLHAYTALDAVALGGDNGFFMEQIVRALTARNKTLRHVSIAVEEWGLCDDLLQTTAAVAECCQRLEVLMITMIEDTIGGMNTVHHSWAPSLLDFIVGWSNTLKALSLSHVRMDRPTLATSVTLAATTFTLAIARLSLVHAHAGALATRHLIERCSRTLAFLEVWDSDMDYGDNSDYPVIEFSSLRHVNFGTEWWPEFDQPLCETNHPSPELLPVKWTCPSIRSLYLSYLHLRGDVDVDIFSRRARELATAGLRELEVEGTEYRDKPGNKSDLEAAKETSGESMDEEEPNIEATRWEWDAEPLDWLSALEKELLDKRVKVSIELELELAL